MEIILFVLIVGLFIYVDYRFKKEALSIGELSDKQTKVVVEFFVSKLQEKGILSESEISSFYEEINQKIKNVVKIDAQIKK